MDGIVTKRFHISGLTPALSQKVIYDRLSSFATVQACDGFGLSNGLNEPRNFAFVTLEGTTSNLSRCLNVLSGATWKGTKLRISEAKPDFRQRLLLDRDVNSDPPRKKRRKTQGVEATNMSLITPENVANRPGWKVTVLGRMIRPARMRPMRPLIGPVESTRIEKNKGIVKTKRKSRNPITRMRRRTIDPTHWGSIYLKGVFLDAGRIPNAIEQDDHSKHHSDNEDSDAIADTDIPAAKLPSASETDMALEKERSMALLQSLFGNSEHDEWGGSESVSGDDDRPPQSESPSSAQDADAMIVDDLSPAEPTLNSKIPSSDSHKSPDKPQTLKDLFAPTNEQANFSIIGHLGLDIDVDDDIYNDLHAPVPSTPSRAKPHKTSAQPTRPVPVDLDHKQPLFFPASTSTRGRLKDLHGVALERGWNWRDPAVGFWRTAGEEEIRAKWETDKTELTRGWKKRWREAHKTRKKRIGGGDQGTV